MHLLLIGVDLRELIGELLLLLFELHAVGGRSALHLLAEHGKLCAVALLQLVNVTCADGGNGGFLPAVHIHQRLECVLFAGAEKPVDRALLIDLAVVGVKARQQIIANDLTGRTLAAQCAGYKFQVLLQRVLAVDLRHKIHDQPGEVIGEIIVIADRQNVVLHGDDRLILAVVPLAACVGKPLDIEGIPPEQAAHGVAYQAFDLTGEVCTAHGHVPVLDLGCQLVLQAVDVDENAVEFFLVRL